MKQHTTSERNRQDAKERNQKIRRSARRGRLTVGLDLGDRKSRYCILDEAGEIVSEGQVPTTEAGLSGLLAKMPASRVALEVGTHSPWVSRHVTGLGHEAIVANAREVKLITHSSRKNDRMDAEQLARLARVDPQLLRPIRHRGEEAQADLAVLRARAELMSARTQLINAARGLAKPMGERLKGCDADQVSTALGKEVSAAVRVVIEPLLKTVETMTQQLAVYDSQIEEIAKRYPETQLLTQVYGVGVLIALTFVLTIEDPARFRHSRDVGAFFGMTPKQRESGESKPELSISKQGDRQVRSLLVQGAHCIMRRGAPESDLRAFGESKLNQSQKQKEKGGKKAKRRAVVAVARKLGVLLHHLWATGEVYDPNYNRKAVEAAGKRKGREAAA
jgi:transposase